MISDVLRNGCDKRVASSNIAAVALLGRLIRQPQYCTSIAHRYHSAATIDQNIILHQTMRQISTLAIKQFRNTRLLDVQKAHNEFDQSGKR